MIDIDNYKNPEEHGIRLLTSIADTISTETQAYRKRERKEETSEEESELLVLGFDGSVGLGPAEARSRSRGCETLPKLVVENTKLFGLMAVFVVAPENDLLAPLVLEEENEDKIDLPVVVAMVAIGYGSGALPSSVALGLVSKSFAMYSNLVLQMSVIIFLHLLIYVFSPNKG
uniref:Uncharacterized protein n=1 Tax=Opuntia streptacantha TaxID=393608 RepID=A0A7C9E5H3_OPUST